MAESIQRYCQSTKNNVAKYADVARVWFDMGAGRCAPEFKTALEQCDRDWYTRSEIINRKPTGVVPVSVESCVKATAALRQCMQGKQDLFRKHIAAMDEGIEENERLRKEPNVEVEDGPTWRWWTGMRNSRVELSPR